MGPSASAQQLHHQHLQTLPKDGGAPQQSRDVQIVRDFIDSPYDPFLILNPNLMTVLCCLDPRPHYPVFTRRWHPTADGETMFSVDEVNYAVAPHAVNPIAVVVPGTGQDLTAAPTKRLVNTLVQHDFAVLVLNYRGVPNHTESQNLETEMETETETETDEASELCRTPKEEELQEKQQRKQRSVPSPTLKLMHPAFTEDLHTLVDIVREQHACVDLHCGNSDSDSEDDDEDDDDDGGRTLTMSRVDNCSNTKEKTWKKKQEETVVRNIYICGFSLGGNIALHYAYESRPSAGGSSSDSADNAAHIGTSEHNDSLFTPPSAATDHQKKKEPHRGIHVRVRAFAAASVPFDVAYCAEHLNLGWRAWLFGLPLALCVRHVVNHAIRQRAPGHDRLCARDVRRMWSMRDVATHFAAPVFGYKDADACFKAMDVCERLKRVDYVPVLVIQAKDDPYFGHDRACDEGGGGGQGGVLAMMQEQTPPGVRIRVSEHGGHCAFADRNWLRDANSGFFQKEFARWFLHFEENSN